MQWRICNTQNCEQLTNTNLEWAKIVDRSFLRVHLLFILLLHLLFILVHLLLML